MKIMQIQAWFICIDLVPITQFENCCTRYHKWGYCPWHGAREPECVLNIRCKSSPRWKRVPPEERKVWHGENTYTHKGVETEYKRNSVGKGAEKEGIFILLTAFIQSVSLTWTGTQWGIPRMTEVMRPYPQVLHCQGLETGLWSN